MECTGRVELINQSNNSSLVFLFGISEESIFLMKDKKSLFTIQGLGIVGSPCTSCELLSKNAECNRSHMRTVRYFTFVITRHRIQSVNSRVKCVCVCPCVIVWVYGG